MDQKYAVIIRTRDVLKKIQAIERSSRMLKRFFSVRCNNGNIKKGIMKMKSIRTSKVTWKNLMVSQRYSSENCQYIDVRH